MKVLVGAFNQEKALVGAFSVIVKTDGSFAALDNISGERSQHSRHARNSDTGSGMQNIVY